MWWSGAFVLMTCHHDKEGSSFPAGCLLGGTCAPMEKDPERSCTTERSKKIGTLSKDTCEHTESVT